MQQQQQVSQEVVQQYNNLKMEYSELLRTSIDIEEEKRENQLVIETIKNLESERRCRRLVGGVLVERTLGEVLNSLKKIRAKANKSKVDKDIREPLSLELQLFHALTYELTLESLEDPVAVVPQVQKQELKSEKLDLEKQLSKQFVQASKTLTQLFEFQLEAQGVQLISAIQEDQVEITFEVALKLGVLLAAYTLTELRTRRLTKAREVEIFNQQNIYKKPNFYGFSYSQHFSKNKNFITSTMRKTEQQLSYFAESKTQSEEQLEQSKLDNTYQNNSPIRRSDPLYHQKINGTIDLDNVMMNDDLLKGAKKRQQSLFMKQPLKCNTPDQTLVFQSDFNLDNQIWQQQLGSNKIQSLQNSKQTIQLENQDLKRDQQKQSQSLKNQTKHHENPQDIQNQFIQLLNHKQQVRNSKIGLWNQSFLILKFMRAVKEMISGRLLSSLNMQILQAIQDNSIDLNSQISFLKYDQRNNNSCFSIRINKFLNSKYFKICSQTLEPDGHLSLVFDIIFFVSTFITIITVPIEIAFFNFLNNQIIDYLFIISAFLFILEIFISLSKGIYEYGQVIKDRKKILANYMNFRFKIDLLLLILIAYFWTIRSPFKISIVILRTPSLKQLSENIEQQLQLNRQQITIIQYLKLVSIIVIMSHIFGCMFYYIGRYYNNSTENTWVHSQNLENKSIGDVYIASFYWAIVTMAGIGYGDIVPMNIYERIYVIFMVLVSNSIRAYTINKIGEILDQYNIHEKQIKQKIMEITKQLNQASISKQLQIKINKQFEFLFFHQLQENCSVKDILQTLSFNLQCQYKIDVFGKFIKNQQIFNSVFSEEFLQEICLTVVEKSFMPEEIIFTKGSEPSQLYLILNGEIELNMIEMQGKQDNLKGNFQTFKKGDILGYEEFISGEQRKNSATAKTVTNAGCIQLKQFLEIIQKFPKDHEIFCMMRDKLVIYKEHNKLLQRLKCLCCKQTNHDTQFCPLVHYIPHETSLILKSQYSKNQERNFFKRRNLKQKAFNQISQIKSFINQLFQDSDLQNKFYQEFNSQIDEKNQDSLQEALKELDKNFEFYGIKFSNNVILSSKDVLQQEDPIKVLQFQKYKNKQKQPENIQQDLQKQNYKSNIQSKTNDMNDDSCIVRFNTEKNIILQQQQSDFNDKDSIKMCQNNQDAYSHINHSLIAIEESPKQQYIQNSPMAHDQENHISIILKNVKGSTAQSNGKIYIKTISNDQKKGVSNDQIVSNHLIIDEQNKMDMNHQQDELTVMKKVNFSNQLIQNNYNLRSKELRVERYQTSKEECENEVFIELDVYKNFVYYFPHNNLEKILNIYSKIKIKRKFKKVINKKFIKR
ncbi:hypothetical protein ABPG72_012300 [Tetrahymena utriculariae]